jgi:hypothetical protein
VSRPFSSAAIILCRCRKLMGYFEKIGNEEMPSSLSTRTPRIEVCHNVSIVVDLHLVSIAADKTPSASCQHEAPVKTQGTIGRIKQSFKEIVADYRHLILQFAELEVSKSRIDIIPGHAWCFCRGDIHH